MSLTLRDDYQLSLAEFRVNIEAVPGGSLLEVHQSPKGLKLLTPCVFYMLPTLGLLTIVQLAFGDYAVDASFVVGYVFFLSLYYCRDKWKKNKQIPQEIVNSIEERFSEAERLDPTAGPMRE